MNNAYIVSAVRSPVGKRNGALSHLHPADLSAVAVEAAVERAGVPAEAIDDVLWGCVVQIGAQSTNLARTVALSAGLPQSVPGTTVDRQCGSSQQAVHFAAQAVLSGVQDVVVAGGVEVMSRVPMDSAIRLGLEHELGHPFGGERFRARYGEQEISQFRGAEMIAEQWELTRAEMEAYAASSHARATEASAAGHFDAEIVPVDGVTRDEGPRADISLEKMAGLKTLAPGGRLTAALASQISDGAAALVVASEAAVRQYGLRPLARIHTLAVVGSDPVVMLTGPIPATAAALKRAGLTIDEIGTFEVNEAFASVPMAWLRDTGADPARTNPDGGAIALGHPLGATGARLMTSLVHRLHREGHRYGLQTMCEGGGMANATIIERV